VEPLNPADLEKLILERKAISKDKLESILNFVKQEDIRNNISCQYILVKNTGDSIREQDLLKILYHHMVMFVVDFGEYRNIEGLEVSEIIAKISEVFRKAKSKFQTKTEKTGEVAELILFLLLEANGITQIVSKMGTKQNTEMPVFGADAIHVQAKDDEIIFHFGEAKMHENFNGAVDSAVNSIENFQDNQIDVEFDIISKNIDRSKFEMFTDQILEYLNPYTSNKENMKISYPILICHNWEALQDLTKREEKSLSEYLKNEFTNSFEKYANKITQKISESKVNDKTFEVFIIPFRDVKDFRKLFLEML